MIPMYQTLGYGWRRIRSRFLPLTPHDLEKLGNKIMATQAELAGILRGITAQLEKSNTEIKGVQTSVDTLNAKIAELEAAIEAGGESTEELTDAVEAVKVAAQTVDDAIPDPVVIPEVPPQVGL